MRRTTLILLALGTAYAVVYLVGATAWFGWRLLEFQRGRPFVPALTIPELGAFLAVHVGSGLVVLAVCGFYIVHTLRTDRLDSNWRAIWLILHVVIGPPAMAVYFFRHVAAARELPGPRVRD